MTQQNIQSFIQDSMLNDTDKQELLNLFAQIGDTEEFRDRLDILLEGTIRSITAETKIGFDKMDADVAKIDEIGNIETEVEETRTGSSGAVDHHTRINQGPEKFTHSLETRLHDAMPLIKNLKWKDEWNLTNARSQLNYSFLAENGAQRASSDLLLVCPRLLNRNLRQSPWKKGEEGQFWLRAFGIHEVVTLSIPDGFALGTLPTAWQQTTPAATSSISYRLSGQTLTYEFDLKQNASLFHQAEYETLRTFYRTTDDRW